MLINYLRWQHLRYRKAATQKSQGSRFFSQHIFFLFLWNTFLGHFLGHFFGKLFGTFFWDYICCDTDKSDDKCLIRKKKKSRGVLNCLCHFSKLQRAAVGKMREKFLFQDIFKMMKTWNNPIQEILQIQKEKYLIEWGFYEKFHIGESWTRFWNTIFFQTSSKWKSKQVWISVVTDASNCCQELLWVVSVRSPNLSQYGENSRQLNLHLGHPYIG